MARYGKVLLQRLTFQYCDRMGCSRGMREYLKEQLPAFASSNPNVRISKEMKRNRFPLVKAEYALPPNDAAHLEKQLWARSSKQQAAADSLQRKSQGHKQPPPRLNSNVVGVKHRSAEEIKNVVWWLSQSQGRPKTRRIPTKHIVSKQPSIQGVWTASTFAVQ